MQIHFLRRAVCVCLALAIAIDPAFAAGISSAVPEKPVLTGEMFKVPEYLGRIETRFKPSQPLRVILLQDAHGIPEAQKNIAALLQAWGREYGIERIGVEGTDEMLDPRFFRSAPSRKKLAALLRRWREQGELSGVVWAAIFSPFRQHFSGIEDRRLFEDGLTFYLRAQAGQKNREEKLEALRAPFSAAARKVFSEELRQADEWIRAFQAERMDLADFLRRMSKISAPPPQSDLAALLHALDFGEAGREGLSRQILPLADALQSRLNTLPKPAAAKLPNDLKALAREKQLFQTAASDPGRFAAFLGKLNRRYALGLTFPPGVSAAAVFYERLLFVHGNVLQDELNSYIESAYRRLAQSDAEKDFAAVSRFLVLCERLSGLKLTREDWQALQDQETAAAAALRITDLPLKEFLDFFRAAFADCRAFYENAAARETRMQQSLLDLLKLSDKKPVVIVAGGFHSEGLRKFLEEQGLAHAAVTPAMRTLPAENPYTRQMGGEVHWNRYLKPEGGKISYFRAFAQAVRDELLAEEKKPEIFLAQWRSRLWLDLAAEGQLDLAGRYLDFFGSGPLPSAWPWRDLGELRRDLELTRSEVRSAAAAPSSSGRPAELSGAAVLAPGQAFDPLRQRGLAGLPATFYTQIVEAALRSEVRNAEDFLQKILAPVSGEPNGNVSIVQGTAPEGGSLLTIEHVAPYENFQVRFRYEIVFYQGTAIRATHIPKYALADQPPRTNKLFVPLPPEGGWEPKTLRRLKQAWRRLTVADPALNKRYTATDLELADYQKKAVKKLRVQLDASQKALGVMATATGKTVVAYTSADQIMSEAKAQTPPGEDAGAILFLVNNKQILGDAEKSLHKMTGGRFTSSRVYKGIEDFSGDFIFATPASLNESRLQRLLQQRKLRLVIVDEVHHLPADSNRLIFRSIEEASLEKQWKTGFLGLTATETRPDRASVIAFFGHEIHAEYGIKRGWKDGFLVQWTYHGGDQDINPEGRGPFRPDDPFYEEMREKMYRNERFPHLFRLYKRQASRQLVPKGLILAPRVSRAKALAAYFRRRGVNAVTLTGKDRTEDPVRFDHYYEAWKTGQWPEDSPYRNEKVPEVVIGVNIFREGVDVPAINILMLWADTNSTIQFVQSVGRGLRISPFKTHISIIDAVGLFRKLKLLRYLGSLSPPRKRGKRGGPAEEDEEGGIEAPEVPKGLTKDVSSVVERYFDDIPGHLTYRYGTYPNIPVGELKKLDQWFAHRAGFAAVKARLPAEGETLAREDMETSLEGWLRLFIQEHMLSPEGISEAAATLFRKRFAYVFDSLIPMNEPADLTFELLEESYIIFYRLVHLLSVIDPRAGEAELLKIYPEFDKKARKRLENRGRNLRTLRRVVFQKSHEEMHRQLWPLVEAAWKRKQEKGVKFLTWNFWNDDYVAMERGDRSVYMFEHAEGEMGADEPGALSSSKYRSQYNPWQQDALIEGYLLDPALIGKLQPGDFELPEDQFATVLRRNMLMEDEKSLRMFHKNLKKAVEDYQTEIRESRLQPETRVFLQSLITSSHFASYLNSEFFRHQLFLEWFQTFRSMHQRHMLDIPEDAAIYQVFEQVARDLGIFYRAEVPGLAGMEIEAESYSAGESSIYLRSNRPEHGDRIYRLPPLTFRVSAKGDVTLTEGSAVEKVYETLDERGRAIILDEIMRYLRVFHERRQAGAERFLIVLPETTAGFFEDLRKAILRDTDWDVFSPRALQSSDPAVLSEWRVNFPGRIARDPKETALAEDGTVYTAALKFVYYWNLFRPRAAELLPRIRNLRGTLGTDESLLAKALPPAERMLQAITDGPPQNVDFDFTTQILFTLGEILGLHAADAPPDEFSKRLANFFLIVHQKPERFWSASSLQKIGDPFEAWQDTPRISALLRQFMLLREQARLEGRRVPDKLIAMITELLDKVEEIQRSGRITFRILDLTLRIEEDGLKPLFAKLQRGESWEQQAIEAKAAAPAPWKTKPRPLFQVSGGKYPSADLLIVASRASTQGGRRTVTPVLHVDPLCSGMEPGHTLELQKLEDVERNSNYCPLCMEAAGLKANYKSLDGRQDEVREQIDEHGIGDTHPAHGHFVDDPEAEQIEEFLEKRSEIRSARAAGLAEDLGGFALERVLGLSMPETRLRALRLAADRGNPELAAAFARMGAQEDRSGLILPGAQDLARQSRQEIREFMRREFGGKSAQGIVVGMRTGQESSERAAQLAAFMAGFLPAQDQTASHLVLTGRGRLAQEEQQALRQRGIHVSSGRSVSKLLALFGQAVFPDMIADPSAAGRVQEKTLRAIELRGEDGAQPEVQALGTDLEAVHAFALARFGGRVQELQAFYRRLSQAVSVFRRYPDFVYGKVIKSAAPGTDFIDVPALSAFFEILAAQAAAIREFAQAA